MTGITRKYNIQFEKENQMLCGTGCMHVRERSTKITVKRVWQHTTEFKKAINCGTLGVENRQCQNESEETK